MFIPGFYYTSAPTKATTVNYKFSLHQASRTFSTRHERGQASYKSRDNNGEPLDWEGVSVQSCL